MGLQHGAGDVPALIGNLGVHPSAEFVVTHGGKAHFAAFDALGQIVARRLGADTLVIAARMQLRRVDPEDSHANIDGLAEPDLGAGLEGVAIDHPYDMGLDRPIERRFCRCPQENRGGESQLRQ